MSLSSFPGFVVLDLASTIFFSYDIIALVRQKVLSGRQVLPETVELTKGQNCNANASSGLHFHLDDSEIMYEDWKVNDSWWSIIILFLSTLPLEYASLFLVGGTEWPNNLMLNRLLYLIHLPRYLNGLSALLARRGYIKNIGFRRTWLLFFTMALAGHLCGSIFYLIGRRQAMHGVKMTWPEAAGIYTVEGTNLTMQQSAAEAYISSLYWAYITMITTGFGDIVSLLFSLY